MTNDWLERTELLLGGQKLALVRQAHVLVVGLGGVGAYAAEMLTRSGIGRLTIVDADCVSPSNLNRQLVALHSTIGRPKAEVLAERLCDINPQITLDVVREFIKDDATDALLDRERFDYVIDAIDTLAPKVNLIKGALERGIPLVSSMGAGAKTDPTLLEIKDISKSHHCPLAHMLRKDCTNWAFVKDLKWFSPRNRSAKDRWSCARRRTKNRMSARSPTCQLYSDAIALRS